MRIGYAGPISFDMLASRLRHSDRQGYSGNRFPQGSLLVSALLDAGHDVDVYALDHEQRADGPVELAGERLRVFVLPYRPRLRWPDAFRVEIAHLVDAIDRGGPDVLHAQWSYEYALAAIASGRPHVVTIRDWAPLIARMQRTPRTWIYRRVRAAMNHRALSRAQHLAVTSPYMAELVERHYNRSPSLVPNALPEAAFAPAAHERREGPPVVLSINNAFDHRKNVDTLLLAFPNVRQVVPEARLRLVGLGFGPGEEAEIWARKHGVAGQVDFVGSLSFAAVLDELADAAVLAHPAREESFGGTLLEAMARGTPVVAGHTSGAAPWVLAEGRAGMLTDVESPERVAEAILEVLTVPELAQRLSSTGRSRAREFDLANTVSAYQRVYERAASGA